MGPIVHRIAEAGKSALVAASLLPAWGLEGAAGAEPGTKEPAAWRYVHPPGGDSWEYAAWRPVELLDTKPADVVERASYRGKVRRYAELPFGAAGSRPILLVLDEAAKRPADLYADRNRDRTIEASERLGPPAECWLIPFDVAGGNADSPGAPTRPLAMRLSRDGRMFQVTSIGYLSGALRVGDRLVAVRRVDGDANGRVSDPRDRIWIDLDGDGHWDPFTEQFPFRPILSLGERRFALRGDEFGVRLVAEPIIGTGTVRLAYRPPQESSSVLELTASFVGDDASAFTLDGAGPHVVPVGRYALTSVSATLADPHHRVPWNYDFSRRSGLEQALWHKVEKDCAVAIDPIGLVRFDIELAGDRIAATPGRALSVEPWLTTPDGLVLRSCRLGTIRTGLADSPRAAIKLARADGALLDSTNTGLS